MATSELTERSPMYVNESLYREFHARYGTRAADLILFYTQTKLYGDKFLRAWYPQRTYYRYRHTLVTDGYLSVDEFESIGGRKAYVP